MKFPAWDGMAHSSNRRAQYRHPKGKPETSPMKLLSRKKIGVTQSPYGESFISFRMATGAG
jgi:hypothetical protein